MDGAATQVLVIRTFGAFSVCVDDKEISDNSPRAGQVWKLFKYLITHRVAPISTEKLIDLMWPDSDVDNPVKALYTIVYRLRTILNQHFIPKQDFILFRHNSYIWNGNASYWLDADEMEQLSRQAEDPMLEPHERIALYRRAFDLYQGDYLAESHGEGWVFSATNYYRKLYNSIALQLANLYAAQKDYASVVTCCDRATEHDPFNESLHAALLRALIAQGLTAQALSHYEYITAVLQKELGLSPSDMLRQAMSAVITTTADGRPGDIKALQDILREDQGQAGGAFYCDLEIFKHIYRLEARTIQRTGLPVTLGLITLTTPEGNIPPDDVLETAFPLLKRAAMFGLRRGDVVTQASKSQILVMLLAANTENSERIMSRLKDIFYTAYRGLPVRFRPVCADLTPDNSLPLR